MVLTFILCFQAPQFFGQFLIMRGDQQAFQQWLTAPPIGMAPRYATVVSDTFNNYFRNNL